MKEKRKLITNVVLYHSQVYVQVWVDLFEHFQVWKSVRGKKAKKHAAKIVTVAVLIYISTYYFVFVVKTKLNRWSDMA